MSGQLPDLPYDAIVALLALSNDKENLAIGPNANAPICQPARPPSTPTTALGQATNAVLQAPQGGLYNPYLGPPTVPRPQAPVPGLNPPGPLAAAAPQALASAVPTPHADQRSVTAQETRKVETEEERLEREIAGCKTQVRLRAIIEADYTPAPPPTAPKSASTSKTRSRSTKPASKAAEKASDRLTLSIVICERRDLVIRQALARHNFLNTYITDASGPPFFCIFTGSLGGKKRAAPINTDDDWAFHLESLLSKRAVTEVDIILPLDTWHAWVNKKRPHSDSIDAAPATRPALPVAQPSDRDTNDVAPGAKKPRLEAFDDDLQELGVHAEDIRKTNFCAEHRTLHWIDKDGNHRAASPFQIKVWSEAVAAGNASLSMPPLDHVAFMRDENGSAPANRILGGKTRAPKQQPQPTINVTIPRDDTLATVITTLAPFLQQFLAKFPTPAPAPPPALPAPQAAPAAPNAAALPVWQHGPQHSASHHCDPEPPLRLTASPPPPDDDILRSCLKEFTIEHQLPPFSESVLQMMDQAFGPAKGPARLRVESDAYISRVSGLSIDDAYLLRDFSAGYDSMINFKRDVRARYQAKLNQA